MQPRHRVQKNGTKLTSQVTGPQSAQNLIHLAAPWGKNAQKLLESWLEDLDIDFNDDHDISLEHWHPQTSKWKEFILENVLVEGLGYVLHCKGWDLIVYKNIQTDIFQIEKFPYFDMLRQGTRQSETANCQKRLTKRSLRNTHREKTQHILISVIPSSRISTIPWPHQDKSILASGCLILIGCFSPPSASDITWNPGPFPLSTFCLDATHSKQILQSHLRHSIDVSIPLGSAKAPSFNMIFQGAFGDGCCNWSQRVQCMNSTLENLLESLFGGLFAHIIHLYRGAWSYVIHAFESFWVLPVQELPLSCWVVAGAGERGKIFICRCTSYWKRITSWTCYLTALVCTPSSINFISHQIRPPPPLPRAFHAPREPLLLHPKWPSTTLGYWSLAIQQLKFWRNLVVSQSLHPAWYRTTRI